jgi:MFS family permease
MIARFFRKGVVRQSYATFCVNLIAVTYGAANGEYRWSFFEQIVKFFIWIPGWPSPTIPLLESKETPLESGPLTVSEASWITSMIYLGGFIITIVSGYAMEKFGRKISILFLAIPAIVSWLLIAYGTNPIYLIVSRLLVGVTGALFHSVPIFISEISDVR